MLFFQRLEISRKSPLWMCKWWIPMYEEHQVKRSIGFFLQKPKVWGKSSLQIVSSLQRSLQSSVWGKGILVTIQVSIQSESWHYRDDSFFTNLCKSYPLSSFVVLLLSQSNDLLLACNYSACKHYMVSWYAFKSLLELFVVLSYLNCFNGCMVVLCCVFFEFCHIVNQGQHCREILSLLL